jgi:hypothetical protein
VATLTVTVGVEDSNILRALGLLANGLDFGAEPYENGFVAGQSHNSLITIFKSHGHDQQGVTRLKIIPALTTPIHFSAMHNHLVLHSTSHGLWEV